MKKQAADMAWTWRLETRDERSVIPPPAARVSIDDDHFHTASQSCYNEQMSINILDC